MRSFLLVLMGLERKFVNDLWKISSAIPEVHNRFGKILDLAIFFWPIFGMGAKNWSGKWGI